MTLALALLAAAAAMAIALLALSVNGGPISPAAQSRAKELFLSRMSDAERRAWSRDHRLTIVGSSGRRYTMMPYDAFNIRAGREAYCLSVLGWIPDYDKLLAQRLLIEADERTFLIIANRKELAP